MRGLTICVLVISAACGGCVGADEDRGVVECETYGPSSKGFNLTVVNAAELVGHCITVTKWNDPDESPVVMSRIDPSGWAFVPIDHADEYMLWAFAPYEDDPECGQSLIATESYPGEGVVDLEVTAGWLCY